MSETACHITLLRTLKGKAIGHLRIFVSCKHESESPLPGVPGTLLDRASWLRQNNNNSQQQKQLQFIKMLYVPEMVQAGRGGRMSHAASNIIPRV